MLALGRANEIRLKRADLRRRVRAGEVSAVDVLLDVPTEAETMSVIALLTAQYRWGRTKALKLLREAMISESRQLGALTERQRLDVASRVIPAPEAGPAVEEVAWRNMSKRAAFRHLTADSVKTLCGSTIVHALQEEPPADRPLCKGCTRTRKSRGW